jgi:hypothetical protein
LSSETRALMEKVGLGGGGGKREEEEGEVEDVVKVCCSFCLVVYVFVVSFPFLTYFFLHLIIFSLVLFSLFLIVFVSFSPVFFPFSTLFAFFWNISSVSHLFILLSTRLWLLIVYYSKAYFRIH